MTDPRMTIIRVQIVNVLRDIIGGELKDEDVELQEREPESGWWDVIVTDSTGDQWRVGYCDDTALYMPKPDCYSILPVGTSNLYDYKQIHGFRQVGGRE